MEVNETPPLAAAKPRDWQAAAGRLPENASKNSRSSIGSEAEVGHHQSAPRRRTRKIQSASERDDPFAHSLETRTSRSRGVEFHAKRNLVDLETPRAPEVLDVTPRENRRVKLALQTARPSAVKMPTGFDFAFQPLLDRNCIVALAELQLIDRAEAGHLIEPSGTGKTRLNLALGMEAVNAGDLSSIRAPAAGRRMRARRRHR
ncbi:MAG TPA: ATP-binding protein [Rhodoblastus sp.]|nr:ATP-binding protein [Rhodoblastus sp.]